MPEITETMNIEFTDPDTREVVGIIPAPYMHDSFEGEIFEEDGDHISEAIMYALKETETEGEYILTVTADKVFLEDEDTVYPVTIDPSFVYNTSSELGDSFVTSKYPNNNYNTDTYLRVGLSGDFDTSRGYVSILSNSEFIVMLSQAASDRQKLAKLLNISNELISYITNADAGCGLIKYGSSLVPFVNKFPRNTRLYKLMTTKPGEETM